MAEGVIQLGESGHLRNELLKYLSPYVLLVQLIINSEAKIIKSSAGHRVHAIHAVERPVAKPHARH